MCRQLGYCQVLAGRFLLISLAGQVLLIHYRECARSRHNEAQRIAVETGRVQRLIETFDVAMPRIPLLSIRCLVDQPRGFARLDIAAREKSRTGGEDRAVVVETAACHGYSPGARKLPSLLRSNHSRRMLRMPASDSL